MGEAQTAAVAAAGVGPRSRKEQYPLRGHGDHLGGWEGSGTTLTPDAEPTGVGRYCQPLAGEPTVIRMTTSEPQSPEIVEQPADSLLWPDPDSGPWLVQAHWALVDGRIDCVGLTLRSYRKAEEMWADEALPRFGPPGRVGRSPVVLNSQVWRSLRISEVLRLLRRRGLQGAQAVLLPFLEHVDPSSPLREGVERTLRGWRQPPVRGPLTREGVAEVYRTAYQRGEAPTKAVERAFRLTASAAAKQVSRARAAGLLPATTKGKAR